MKFFSIKYINEIYLVENNYTTYVLFSRNFIIYFCNNHSFIYVQDCCVV